MFSFSGGEDVARGIREHTLHFKQLQEPMGAMTGKSEIRGIVTSHWLLNKTYYSRALLAIHKHRNKGSLEFIDHFTHEIEMSFLV